MEKIRVLWVGKNKFKALESLENEYQEKIKRIVSFKIDSLPKKGKNISGKKIIKEEGNSILKKITKDDYLILLDEKGKEFDSINFSNFLEDKINSPKRINFVVGSFSGVSEDVKKRADFKISLSKMTFSNYIARIVLLEQIFRALTLIKGMEYHR